MEKLDTKTKLSTLWVFALLNYLYCDLIGLMDSNLLKQFLTGTVGGLEFTQGFLLGASILMEIPIAMILFSRLFRYKINRWSNIIAGTFMTLVQIGTLIMGTSTIYYIFFSIIELAATVSIVWIAWRWKNS